MIVRGTPITTPAGDVPVEYLKIGDHVLTYDLGFQPIKWIGSSAIVAKDIDEDLLPIRLEPNALGDGQPGQAISVSPAHRVFWTGQVAEALFGRKKVLIPAKHTINGRKIRRDVEARRITYHHFLLDDHKVVFSSGLKSESYFPSASEVSKTALETRNELLNVFPELRDVGRNYARRNTSPSLHAFEFDPLGALAGKLLYPT